MPVYTKTTTFTRESEPKVINPGEEITLRTQQVGDVGARREFARVSQGDEVELFVTTVIGGEATEERLPVAIDGTFQHTLRRDEINRAALGASVIHPKILNHEVGWTEEPLDPSPARKK